MMADESGEVAHAEATKLKGASWLRSWATVFPPQRLHPSIKRTIGILS